MRIKLINIFKLLKTDFGGRWQSKDPKLTSSHGYNYVNTHIHVHNPDNNLKTGRTAFPQLNTVHTQEGGKDKDGTRAGGGGG